MLYLYYCTDQCITCKINTADANTRCQHFIPNGIQGRTHPHPGRQFIGNTFHAYLPDSKEGRQVLDLLMKAFNAKIIFTIGKNDRVVWNDIHHKTNLQVISYINFFVNTFLSLQVWLSR